MRIPRCLWQVRRAHFGERHRRGMQPTKAWMKGVAEKYNRQRPASCRDTDHLPIPSVSQLRIRIFGPETRRGTDKAAHLSVSQLGNRNFDPELLRDTDTTSEWSVSWQRKNSESRTRNTPFPSTRVARKGDYHTGRRLSGSSGSFCGLSVLNDNGGLFRQTGAQRPRAGVSVGHSDVRHSLISAVGAHPSASGGVCGGSLCASLAAGRIGWAV